MKLDDNLDFNFTSVFNINNKISLKRKIILSFFLFTSLYSGLYLLSSHIQTKEPNVIYLQSSNLNILNDVSVKFLDYFFNNSINATFDSSSNQITKLSILDSKNYYLHLNQDKLMHDAIYGLIFDKANILIDGVNTSFKNKLLSFDILNIYDVNNQKGIFIKVKYSQSYIYNSDEITVQKEAIVDLKLDENNKIVDYFIL